MSVRFSVTEVALAARCPRQMLFAREGLRIVEGAGGIGQTAHAVLAAFVQRGAASLADALAREPLDEDGLLRAVTEALYSELYAHAPAVAQKITAQELVRLARVVFDLGALAGELLVRARKSGLRGDEAFARTFVSTIGSTTTSSPLSSASRPSRRRDSACPPRAGEGSSWRTTSPPLRVIMERKTFGSIVNLMNRTAPSTNTLYDFPAVTGNVIVSPPTPIVLCAQVRYAIGVVVQLSVT